MKSREIVKAENSLRDFILEEYTDQKDQRLADIYKCRGMSLTINWRPDVRPQFQVEIGAFSATFSIETGKKIEGSLQGCDISLVTKWAMSSLNRSLLQAIWDTDAKAKKEIRLKPFDIT